MVWDGKCGFCHYWIIRWKIKTGDTIKYASFQQQAADFPDIPIKRFEEAVRLIEVDGTIYSGPAAAFRSFYLNHQYKWLFQWYIQSPLFKKMCDLIYHFMATHREFMFKLTKLLWGKNPAKPKSYWRYYLLGLVAVVVIIIIL